MRYLMTIILATMLAAAVVVGIEVWKEIKGICNG